MHRHAAEVELTRLDEEAEQGKRDHQRKADRSQHRSLFHGLDHPVGHGDTCQEATNRLRRPEYRQQDQLDIRERQVRLENESHDQLMEQEQQFRQDEDHHREQPEVNHQKEQHQPVIKQFR